LIDTATAAMHMARTIHQRVVDDSPLPSDAGNVLTRLRTNGRTDERFLDRDPDEVSVVAPAGEPEREPTGTAFAERVEGPDVAFGDTRQQRRVTRRPSIPHLSRPRGRKVSA
jgi:hypothetical protein